MSAASHQPNVEAYAQLTRDIGACVDNAGREGKLSPDEIISVVMYVALRFVESHNGAGAPLEFLKTLAQKLESITPFDGSVQ